MRRAAQVLLLAAAGALVAPAVAEAQCWTGYCESYGYDVGGYVYGYSRTYGYYGDFFLVETSLTDPQWSTVSNWAQGQFEVTAEVWGEAGSSGDYYIDGNHYYWGWDPWEGWHWDGASSYDVYVFAPPPPPQITVCPLPSPAWGPGSQSAVIGGSGFWGNTPQVSWSGNGGANFLEWSSATVTSDSQIDLSVSLAPVTSEGSITLGVGTAICMFAVQPPPPPAVVTLAPEPLYLSTGDTNRQVTTSVSPSTISFTAVYGYNREASQPPGGQCNVNLSIPNGSGTGSVNSTVTASPAGCSNVLNVYATAAATTSNYVTVVVPPQKLIQMLNGEAGGQTAAGDMSQLSIGVAARNRFGDSDFGGYSTYNDVISHGFAPSGINYGHDPELPNAAKVYTNDASTVNIIEDAKCFWSPTATQWSIVQGALQSQTTVFPAGTGAPACWSSLPRQIIYKSSVALTTQPSPYAGAPAFLFLRRRNANDPAVRQIN